MTATGSRAPVRRMHPEDRREQILRESLRLIATSGFNAVSLSDVARACGIQKSSVLHHFPSMNDLLLAVLTLREQQDLLFYTALDIESPAGARSADPTASRQLFTRLFHHNLERPDFVRLYVILSAEALAPEHPAHAFYAENTARARTEITSALAWKPEPALAAVELLSFWQGLEAARCHDPSLDVRAVWETFCDRFFA